MRTNRKGDKMEISKGVTLDYTGGAIVLKAEIAGLALPVLQDIKAKVDSGAIDPIKGTDLDKMLLDQVIDALIAAVK